MFTSGPSADERLSLDVAVIHQPIKILGVNDDEESVVSTLSTEGDEDDPASLSSEDHSCNSSGKPRSIFSNYWSKDGRSLPQPASPVPRAPSPSTVMFNDPYKHFGLSLDSPKKAKEEDSINTYEGMLRQCEVVRVPARRSPYESRPLWMSWFTDSAPTLGGAGMNTSLNLWGQRQAQSESALHRKPLKPAIRKGRFSLQNKQSSPPAESSHVRFQSVIQVCTFEPPVESWAPTGWSSWFE